MTDLKFGVFLNPGGDRAGSTVENTRTAEAAGCARRRSGECEIMMEKTMPGENSNPVEFPGCHHVQQRLAKAGLQGPDVRPDLIIGRSTPGPDAVPAGIHTESAATARVIAAADEARRRIERDLHDGLQQRLLSLLLRAALAKASVPGDQQQLKRELARIADGLAAALEAVREISRGIHPAILSEGGLGPAAEALARNSPVPVTLHTGLQSRLPDRVEIGAYYILSEALANAAKHAQATTVDIWVGHREHALDLSVRDDGIGGADGSGPGLTGLADRVHALAGTMQLISPPGHGTHLRISLPTGPGQPD